MSSPSPAKIASFWRPTAPLSLDPRRLSASIAGLGLDLRFVSPALLPSRLDPSRVDYLAGKISAPGARINRDLVPVSYYFHSVLWAGQFRGIESRLLRAFGRIAPGWILDAPLVFFAFGLASPGVFPKALPGPLPGPRGRYGIHLDRRRAGRFHRLPGPLRLRLRQDPSPPGDVHGRARPRVSRGPVPETAGGADLALVQGAFVFCFSSPTRAFPGPEASSSCSPCSSSSAASAATFSFPRTGICCENRPTRASAYGVDLLASFAGVILASALIIPLFGIPALILRLALLNALCFVYVLALPTLRLRFCNFSVPGETD